MKINNIIFYLNRPSKLATAVCAACIGMLVFPSNALAQDNETDNAQVTSERKLVGPQKKDRKSTRLNSSH